MAPTDNSPVLPSNFEFICSTKANDVVPCFKYKSSKTGITLVVAEVPGPLVNGFFVLATEALDDDGLPHTLEHLIFLGSEEYPYKGVLDLLANRNLADGTNAWTDTDHTCYTITTAGSEGFLNLMPVYLDHILYPTLTDAGFVTEVHHIAGDGDDAGVVYCEMQGRENSCESRAQLELLRAAYPGECGYKSETGGLMKNLRESTDNTKVRNYHKSFYRPDNLTLIITGQVKPEDIFKTLQPLEDKIVAKGTLPPFTRPWQSKVPPLLESKDITVPYPCDEEDNGMVYVGWRGPTAVSEIYQLSACSVLLKYLTETSVSPLQKEFVEINDPYASSVRYNLLENSSSLVYLIFENVPKNKIYDIKGLLLPILKKIAEEENAFNLKRMKSVVQKQKLETLCNIEQETHKAVAFMAIGDTLYGNTNDHFRQRLNPVGDYDKMANEPQSFWTNLLKKYFIDGSNVTVYGVPSIEEKKKMTEEEQKRVEKQRKELGEEGLKKKEEELNVAIAANEISPPEEMLTKSAIPSTKSINFHSISSFTSDSPEQHENLDLAKVPVYTLLDNLATNFVYMVVLMDTKPLSKELRMYLPLFLELIFESPVQRGNVLVPYEDVVSELEEDTIDSQFNIGISSSGRFTCGPYCQSVNISIQVEPAKYEKGIKWLHELLFNTKVVEDRLKVVATKMVNDVSQLKRNGSKMVRELMKGILYDTENNQYANSLLRQLKFLTNVLKKLEDETESAKVISDLEKIRSLLTTPANIVVHMAADLKALTLKFPDLAQPWANFLKPGQAVSKNKLSTPADHKYIQPSNGKESGCIVGMGCVESAFLCQTTPCRLNFLDPDLPAVLVFLQYLTQLEGPMWRQIRGLGLSYGYNIFPLPNEALLYLGFYKSTNILGAYKEAKSIIENQLKPDSKWDPILLDSAKSSVIFEIIEREKTIGYVVSQSLISYFKNVGHDYNRKLVDGISNVKEEDLNRVGAQYIAPLFNPSDCKISIVCHPSKTEEVRASFEEQNYKLAVYQSLEESFLNEF